MKSKKLIGRRVIIGGVMLLGLLLILEPTSSARPALPNGIGDEMSQRAKATAVATSASDAATVRSEASRDRGFVVSVVARDGRAISGALVQGENEKASSDRDGRAFLEVIPERVTVFHPSFAPLAASLDDHARQAGAMVARLGVPSVLDCRVIDDFTEAVIPNALVYVAKGGGMGAPRFDQNLELTDGQIDLAATAEGGVVYSRSAKAIDGVCSISGLSQGAHQVVAHVFGYANMPLTGEAKATRSRAPRHGVIADISEGRNTVTLRMRRVYVAAHAVSNHTNLPDESLRALVSFSSSMPRDLRSLTHEMSQLGQAAREAVDHRVGGAAVLFVKLAMQERAVFSNNKCEIIVRCWPDFNEKATAKWVPLSEFNSEHVMETRITQQFRVGSLRVTAPYKMTAHWVTSDGSNRGAVVVGDGESPESHTVPAGRYALRPSQMDLLREEGRLREVEVLEGRQTEIDLREGLPAVANLRIQVVDAGGRPAVGSVVRIMGPGGYHTFQPPTADLTVTCEPGEYKVTVKFTSLESERVVDVVALPGQVQSVVVQPSP
jgi:hypothetical protein